MSKGNTYENDPLKLIFNGTPIAGLADNAASGALTNLYVALHTADPGEAGDQTTSEATYPGYARVDVVRSDAGWTVTDNSVSPVERIEFGAATAGGETITHFSVGTAATGTGKILYSGSVAPTIAVSSGVTPILTTSTAITED